MAPKVALGVDPDTHSTAWAIVSETEVMSVGLLRRKRGSTVGMVEIVSLWTPPTASLNIAVVEGQSLHYGGKAPPSDLFPLAHVTGAVACSIFRGVARVPVIVPTPSEWKGQVPKQIHHARILSAYGILFETASGYCYPSGCAVAAKIRGAAALNKGDWKHVVDAIGLARYGLTRLS